MTLAEILGWMGFMGMILPMVMGLRQWRLLDNTRQLVVLLVAVCFMNQLAATIVGYFLQINNLLFYHFYTVMEGMTLLYILGNLPGQNLRRSAVWGLLIGFAALCMADIGISYVDGNFLFPSYSRALEALLILGLVFRHVILTMRHGKIDHIHRWLQAGWLLYFGGNLLLFVYSNQVEYLSSDRDYGLIWTIHGVLNLVLYASYARALLEPKPKSHGKYLSA